MIVDIIEKYVKETPNKTAIICDDAKLSYFELAEEIDKIANVLKFLGIEKGDKVGFFMDNNTFTPAACLACLKIGAATVFTGLYSSFSETVFQSNLCNTKLYFVSNELYPKLNNIKKHTNVKNIVVIDGKADKGDFELENLYDKTKRSGAVEDAAVDINSPALIFSTSGTTGMPKAAVHTFKSVLANAKFRAETINHTSSDLMLTTSFLCHAAANIIVLFPLLYVGGTAIFTAKHDDMRHVVDIMKKYKATHIAATPIGWSEILKMNDLNPKDFKHIKYAITGGNTVPENLQQRFKKLFGVPLTQSLGMTECGGYMTTPPNQPLKIGSIGKPIKGVSVRLADHNYNDVKEGQVGEILVKGDNVICCYCNNKEATEEVFIDGYLKTGDLAYKDKNGYYFFQGRKKNIIIRGTTNVNPQYVENAIIKHSDVESCIVFGVDDDKVGQRIAACILPKDKNIQMEKEQLREFLSEFVGKDKMPDYFLFFEQFPTDTTIGKINIKKLKQIVDNYIKNKRLEE